jgi:multiple sugar transport system substrate-binding protein
VNGEYKGVVLMKSFRAMFSLLLITAFILTQAGCGAPPQRKDELVMWLVGSEAQAKTIMKLSEAFTEETGVKVFCQAISWGDAHSRYLTSIAGDVTPDIGTMGLTWGMEFGELGAMVDFRKEYPDDVAELEKKIFPGILHSTRFGDKVYGVPFDLSEHIMYYRTDIIKNPPETWEELIEVLRILKTEKRGAIIDWGSLDWIGYSPFLWQAGGTYYNEDYTKATLDTPEAAQSLAFFAQLYKEGVPRTPVPIEQGMRTGDYPLAISGNWKIISLTVGAPEIKDKWAIAMLPEGPSGKRTAFIGGRILGIFSKSPKKKEAWEFIKFLFQPENQVKIYEDSLETEDAYLPSNMDTWKKLPMDRKFKKVLEQQARDAKGPPPVLGWDASTRHLNHAIQMVILKDADPAEELQEANKEMQAELEKAKK